LHQAALLGGVTDGAFDLRLVEHATRHQSVETAG